LVSEKQVHVLNHLDEINAISLTALAGHVGVTLGTMSITVDRLVRRGDVAPGQCGDQGPPRSV